MGEGGAGEGLEVDEVGLLLRRVRSRHRVGEHGRGQAVAADGRGTAADRHLVLVRAHPALIGDWSGNNNEK